MEVQAFEAFEVGGRLDLGAERAEAGAGGARVVELDVDLGVIVAYGALRWMSRLGPLDRGSVAAHYGSTSLVTFTPLFLLGIIMYRQFAGLYTEKVREQIQVRAIAQAVMPGRRYRLMEFCGGHTHAISRYGVLELLPPNVRMIHGPGCPVCVLPIGRVDLAIQLALQHDVILCTYGDTLRVPASDNLSLTKAKARGGDIRMVYSAADALQLARDHPERQVVFFAIGFETTTPPTALVIRDAAREGLKNFSVMCCHVLTPPAIRAILDGAEAEETAEIEGFVGPAHVSIVIGSDPYARFASEYHKPVVIAGFEPLDVLQAILMLVRQVNEGRAEVENEFSRAVTRAVQAGVRSIEHGNFMSKDTVAMMAGAESARASERASPSGPQISTRSNARRSTDTGRSGCTRWTASSRRRAWTSRSCRTAMPN